MYYYKQKDLEPNQALSKVEIILFFSIIIQHAIFTLLMSNTNTQLSTTLTTIKDYAIGGKLCLVLKTLPTPHNWRGHGPQRKPIIDFLKSV